MAAPERGPTEEAVLLEQLRLVVRNQTAGISAVFVIAWLLAWRLADDLGQVTMTLWAGSMTVFLAVAGHHARRNLKHGIAPQRARYVKRRLMIGGIVHGLLWGTLGWLTLGQAPEKHSLLVLAVLAGVSGGTTATLAPLLSLQAAMLVPLFLLITLRVWLLEDPAYFGLGITFLVYLGSLLQHGRNNALATRATIDLRFENLHLLEQLNAETLVAQQARLDAEQANAAKSRFLAAASHDLRQPIHAQGLFLEVLSRTRLDAHQRELLASAGLARESSAEMLNTLLDFSRIEAGVVEPQVQAFRVQALLNKIEREFVQLADAKGLSYRSRESALVLHSDPALIELILRNLVSNAIKYTQRGGLLVTCRARADMVRLEVWDTGVGIAPAEREQVFREFTQLGNSERDRNKGLGLGLAIAKGLAAALGHRLSLRSVPGRGSVFSLEVPVAPPLLPIPSPVAPPRPAEPLALQVLVVDDDVQVRTGMQHLLQDWGCECTVAHDIDDALALAQGRHLDLVICDYRLGEQRTGIQAVAALRAKTRDTLAALLITADTAPDRLREAMASGIPLLHKPVATGQLYRSVAAVRAGAAGTS